WKKNCQEAPPNILTIWVSYDSTLYDMGSNTPTRVTVEDNGRSEAFHYHFSDPGEAHESDCRVKRGSGPIEHWFPILTEPIMEKYDCPSIHTYLSSYGPTRSSDPPVEIIAITFYQDSHSIGTNYQITAEEARILARSSKGDHLYIGFEDRGAKELLDKLRLLVDEERIFLENPPALFDVP